jgi:hypothetical protein
MQFFFRLWDTNLGTNKEVWTDIANQISEQPDVFGAPVGWEAAKEQFLRSIEKHRIKKKVSGGQESSTEWEKYLDSVLQYMAFEELEKEEAKQKILKRKLKRAGATLDLLNAQGSTVSAQASSSSSSSGDAKRVRAEETFIVVDTEEEERKKILLLLQQNLAAAQSIVKTTTLAIEKLNRM